MTANRRQLQITARALEEAVTGALGGPLGRHPEPMDNAQELSARQTAEALRLMCFEQRELVSRALERLVRGAYGSCEDCCQPIDPDRLRVLPEATRCVGCQRRRDARPS